MSAQGWASIPRWLLYTPEIGPHAKLVYVVIQSHTDENGSAWPSRELIADESGLSAASVKRATAELVALGVVEVRRRRKLDGRHSSNIYRVSTTRPQSGDKSRHGSV